MNTELNALQKAKEILGSEAALAELLGVTQPTINYAFKKKGRAQAEWCLPIEEATNGQVTRHDLRPDLWPHDEAAA